MNWLNNLPLKRKLTLIILLICSVVLLLACTVLAADGLYDFRQAMVRDTTVLADVLAGNTRAALAFQDDNETLRSQVEEVRSACPPIFLSLISGV